MIEPTRPTDAELLELVGSKSPSELTEDEVQWLRVRVQESAELRTELIDHMHMESYLHAVLGEFRVSVDDLAQRVHERNRVRRRRFTYGLGLGLLLLAGLACGAWFVATRPAANGDRLVAGNEKGDGGRTQDVTRDSDDPGIGRSERPVVTEDPGPTAVESTDSADTPPWSITVEAEAYVHSNLVTDRETYGREIGVLVDGPEKPGFVEFVVEPPRPGLHQLELRYAADERRPLRLMVNGELVREDAAGESTQGWGPADQRAGVLARIVLPGGRTVVRFEGPSFPHLDKLAIVEVRDGEGPVAEGRLASDLPPLVLRDAGEGEPGVDPLVPTGPWAKHLASALEPLTFEEVCTDPLQPEPFEGFSRGDLEQWFESGPGGWNIQAQRTYERQWAGFEGTGRLRAPWPVDAALRISMTDFHQFEMQFWNGDRGVALRPDAQRRPGVWGAYSISRVADGAAQDYVLLTTDSIRHQRTDWGTMEIRWQTGTLVMTRGAIRLVTVPFDAPPSEVLFVGRVGIGGLTMFRSTPVPDSKPTTHRLVRAVDQPARLDWGTTIRDASGTEYFTSVKEAAEPTWTVPSFPPGLDDGANERVAATLTGHADGTVELAVARTDRTIDAAAHIVEAGLHEFVFRVEGAERGTGLFLGDEFGRPLERLGFFHENHTQGIAFRLFAPEDRTTQAHTERYHQPWPYAGRDQWFRIVRGLDVIKLFVSGDGIHWGQVEQRSLARAAGGPTTIGLFCHPTNEPRSIRLRSVSVREFSGLLALAEEPIRRRVPVDDLVAANSTFEHWFVQVVESQPDDVPFPEWRAACALVTLEQRPLSALIEPLTWALVDEACERLPVDECRSVLDDVGELRDLRAGDRVTRFARSYESLGRKLVEAGAPGAFLTALNGWMRAPFWTDVELRPAMPDLARADVLEQAFAPDWSAVEGICRVRRFHELPGNPVRQHEWTARELKTLFPWAEVVARRELELSIDRTLPVYDRNWRHPLVSQLSKEAYNVMGEFESALEAGAFADACEIVEATDEQGVVGLLPDARDPQLLISLPRAVATAMGEYPELRTTMERNLGPVARLRVRGAMAVGDVDTVHSATIRYYGTEAAATARAWLGDRDLAAGRIAQAAEHYRVAVATTSPQERAEIENRLALAEAMLGRVRAVDDEPVRLGEVSLTPATFEGMLAEIAKTGDDGARLVVDAAETAIGQFPAVAYRTEASGRFDGDVGQNPNHGMPANVDWAGRQLAVAVNGDLFIVSNRFQITAYRTYDGTRAWTTGLGGEQGHTHAWSLEAFRPLVVGGRVFARRLTKHGPELACLDRQTGQVLWHTGPEIDFASDPVVLDGRLLGVVIHDVGDQNVELELVSVHPEKGTILLRAPLLRQRDLWNGMPPCRLVAAEGRVLCSVGASLVSADGMGHVEWLRQRDWLPVPLNERWQFVHDDRPLVVGDRLYVSQPHTYAVACYEIGSGRRIWEKSVPAIQTIVGYDPAGRLLVIRTDSGFEARSAVDGRPIWRRRVEEAFDGGQLIDGTIVFARRRPEKMFGRGPQVVPDLAWLDVATGGETAHVLLPELAGREVEFGPLVTTGAAAWLFTGRGRREVHRELVRLQPDAGTQPKSAPLVVGAWDLGVEPGIRTWIDTIAPGWSLVSVESNREGSGGYRGDFAGEQGVFVTTAAVDRPASFTKEIDVPNGSSELVLRVGNEGGEGWRLRVLVDGATVHDDLVKQRWNDVRVPLGSRVGSTARVTLVHEMHETGSGKHGFWKRIAIEGR